MDAKDRRIAQLERRVAELEALFQAALDEIASLKKNSGNSSKRIPSTNSVFRPSVFLPM